MKSKKILSVLLAIVMVASVMSISVFAEDALIYTDAASYSVNAKASLDRESFSATLNIDYSKISALDGASPDVTGHITSVVATYTAVDGTVHTADYVAAPEDFFAIFDTVKADIATINEHNSTAEDADKLPHASPIDLAVTSEIQVSDPKAFGALEYTIDIVGFSEALEVGLGPVDDILSSVTFPVQISFPGTVEEFPSVSSSTVISKPNKIEYTDAEKFDPTGLVLDLSLSNGESGIFTYSEETAHMFYCTPTSSEKLTCYDSEVAIDFNGLQICKIPISVEHQWSADYVSITTDKYYENKPGYHAIVCEGCGETHDAQPHVVADEEAWTANGDQGFLSNGTESNVCADCGTTLIRDAHGSADYNEALADYHFIRVILDYINMLLNIINGTMK